MNDIAIIVIGIVIIFTSFKLLMDMKKTRKEFEDLKRTNSDLNVEFGAQEGTGIELVKKQYPDLQMKDDFRQKVEPHSIAAGMNDPSEMQKKAFQEKEEWKHS